MRAPLVGTYEIPFPSDVGSCEQSAQLGTLSMREGVFDVDKEGGLGVAFRQGWVAV